ncbi:MAG: hypothetical protein ACOCP4_05010 [Candidatus Woesearchaeota archaeon]
MNSFIALALVNDISMSAINQFQPIMIISLFMNWNMNNCIRYKMISIKKIVDICFVIIFLFVFNSLNNLEYAFSILLLVNPDMWYNAMK